MVRSGQTFKYLGVYIKKMEFTDKYISTSDKLLDAKSTKTVISDDSFAIGELLEKIMIQLSRGKNG